MIHDDGVHALSEALKGNSTLETLNLKCEHEKQDVQNQKATQTTTTKAVNQIFDEGACSMSEALKVNTTLASLNLKCVFQQQNNAQHGNDFLNENESNRQWNRC